MALSDLMNELEQAVNLHKEKELAFQEAEKAVAAASSEYAKAVDLVNELKNKINETLGSLTGGRVRQS